MEETLLTAAKRIVRFVRADDHAHGGLLSIDTIQAANMLEQQIMTEEAKQKARADAQPR